MRPEILRLLMKELEAKVSVTIQKANFNAS